MASNKPEPDGVMAVRNLRKAWRVLLESELGVQKLASVAKMRVDSINEAEAVLWDSAAADDATDEVDSVCLAALIAARWAHDFYYGVERAVRQAAATNDPTARMAALLGPRGALSASVALDVWTARAATARTLLEETGEWRRLASISAAVPKSLYMTLRGVAGHPACVALGFAIRTRNRFALALADPVPGADEDAASIMGAANVIGRECEEIGLDAIVAGWWRIMLFDAEHIASPLSEEEQESMEAGIEEQRARWVAADVELPAPQLHPAVEVYNRLSPSCREVLRAFIVDSRPSMTGDEVRKRINVERTSRRAETNSTKPKDLSRDPMKRPGVVWHLVGNVRRGKDGKLVMGSPMPNQGSPPEPLIEHVPDSNHRKQLTDAARGMRQELADVLGRTVG